MLPRFILAAALLALLPPFARAEPHLFPLDPATLGGADVFTLAEQLVARAATDAQLAFDPAPRPLPPRVIVPLAPVESDPPKTRTVFFWRGDMLPDQMAPAETGTLHRRKPQKDGTWKTTLTRPGAIETFGDKLQPGPFAVAPAPLPEWVIETPYHLGAAGPATATLLLWRSAEEGTPPLAGAIALTDAPAELPPALEALLPPFTESAAWQALWQIYSAP
ncbi:MAG: hypothetical protein GX803_03335 [Lentisphaerae bacterium]|nr:hypothetical protein [Lentisphaerota bacterium]